MSVSCRWSDGDPRNESDAYGHQHYPGRQQHFSGGGVHAFYWKAEDLIETNKSLLKTKPPPSVATR